MSYILLLNVISSFLFVYILLVTIRIIFTWFKPEVDGKPWHYLCLITGRYLAMFRGIKGLRKGVFDFSPVLAISILFFVQQVIDRVIFYLRTMGKFSLGIGLSVLFSSLWNSIFWISIFFGILCIIRFYNIFFHRTPDADIMGTIDLALQPMVAFVMKFLPRKCEYPKLLFVSILFLATILLLGSLFVYYLGRLLVSLPI
ncbi:MAG: YggT family protein [Spirochaetales bacterium]|nr:YggT family protein [Spirochaetales bacterium]